MSMTGWSEEHIAGSDAAWLGRAVGSVGSGTSVQQSLPSKRMRLVIDLSSSADEQEQAVTQEHSAPVHFEERQRLSGSRKRLWGTFEEARDGQAPYRRAHFRTDTDLALRSGMTRRTVMQPAAPLEFQVLNANESPQGMPMHASSTWAKPDTHPSAASPSSLLAPLMLDDTAMQQRPACVEQLSIAPNQLPAADLIGSFSGEVSHSRRSTIHQRFKTAQQQANRTAAYDIQTPHAMLHGGPGEHVPLPAAQDRDGTGLQRLLQDDKRRVQLASERMQRRAGLDSDHPRPDRLPLSTAPGSPSATHRQTASPYAHSMPSDLPRIPDMLRRTRTSRATPTTARPSWATMAVLEPLIPLSLLMDDIGRDLDGVFDRPQLQQPPVQPDSPRTSRSRAAATRVPIDDGMLASELTGRPMMDNDGPSGPDAFEMGLRGALRRARAVHANSIENGRNNEAVEPRGDGPGGMPWGMYRSAARNASGFMTLDERMPGLTRPGRHISPWGAMLPPGFGPGGMYGDLLAGAMRSGLPTHLLLSDRDFTPDDYDMLCRLDETVENRKGATQQEIDAIPIQVVEAILHPTQGVSKDRTAPSPSDSDASSVDSPSAAAAANANTLASAEAATVPSEAAVLVPGTGGDMPRPGSGRCTICLDDWVEGSVLRRMPCSHLFHKDCVDTWFKQKACCPICQRSCKSML